MQEEGAVSSSFWCCVLAPALGANTGVLCTHSPSPWWRSSLYPTCHQVAGRSLQGMVPYQGFSVCLCCWQISLLAIVLVNSALIKEIHVVESAYNLHPHHHGYWSRVPFKAVHCGIVCYAAKTNRYMLEGDILWNIFCTGLGILDFITVLY